MTSAIGQPALLFATMTERQPAEEEKMPAIDPDDDRPKKKGGHEVGQDLTLLSVGELAERINLLKNEIGRLEAEMSRKRASQSAADAIFKK